VTTPKIALELVKQGIVIAMSLLKTVEGSKSNVLLLKHEVQQLPEIAIRLGAHLDHELQSVSIDILNWEQAKLDYERSSWWSNPGKPDEQKKKDFLLTKSAFQKATKSITTLSKVVDGAITRLSTASDFVSHSNMLLQGTYDTLRKDEKTLQFEMQIVFTNWQQEQIRTSIDHAVDQLLEVQKSNKEVVDAVMAFGLQLLEEPE